MKAMQAAIPPENTTVHFSQFTDEEKKDFFAMLDEFFSARTHAADMCLKAIGHGLCSTVFKAPFAPRYRLTEEGGIAAEVCIKQVDVDEQIPPHNVQHEVNLLQRLRHAHIGTLFAAFTDTPDQFTMTYNLVMPLYPCKLTDILSDPQFRPDTDYAADKQQLSAWVVYMHGKGYAAFVYSILHQVLSALEYLHSEQVAHRDIKPANVLLASDGTVKLIDFDVAWFAGIHEQAPFGPAATKDECDRARISDVGTGAFRAPELLFAPEHGYDAYSADIWSFGMLLTTFFTDVEPVATASEGEEESWRDPASEVTPWQRALFPPEPCSPKRPMFMQKSCVYARKTLFDASHGDVGYAGDMFKMLGLPDEYAAWPESADFQPMLKQFPFVAQPEGQPLEPRMPLLQVLGMDKTPQATALHALVKKLVPMLLRLSASQRPTAAAMLCEVESMHSSCC
ncbi:hypothetical protein MVES_002763 [Malassezia vespertilionis]|uniref:Protein kinase domain-containing protein n=1 Tax=Malassezia vespertilionis TaxID=2020962 RepID=A0A2N1J901_9BASI|nr:hypothetical protein MVES_002763 [Malassezia vespertilionis]